MLAMAVLIALPAYGDAASDSMARGRAWLDKGENRRAIASFSRVVSIHPDDAAGYMWRGLAGLQLGEAAAAMKDFDRAVALAPRQGLPYYFRARGQIALKEPHLALDDFARALDRDPTLVDAWSRRGQFYNDTLHEYARAVDDFTRAIALRPDDPFLYNDRAHALANLQRFDSAFADYARAIELQPDLPLTWENRGRTRCTVEDFEGALADEDHALALAPGYPRAMYWRGLALYGLGRWAQAAGQLTAYVKARSNDTAGWEARARVWRALGRNDLADEDEAEAARLKVLRAQRPVVAPPSD
jgi:tetratricopeptide (TPR) repeat protein